MKRSGLLAAVAGVAVLVGCTDMTPKQQGTMRGALIRAGAGAGIASISGGNAWTGAAVGGVCARGPLALERVARDPDDPERLL